jgi:hypothetical protein
MATTCFKPRQSRSDTLSRVSQIVRAGGSRKMEPSLTLPPRCEPDSWGKPCQVVIKKTNHLILLYF